MFLKSLTIFSEHHIIREIKFHQGMNLIVDESKAPDESKKSGNNVGKTTVLRLIDFCLGGDADGIYRDPEFPKKYNEEVKSFLTKNSILVSLELTADLDDPQAKNIIIHRNFLQRNRKIQSLNGVNFANDHAFDSALKAEMFDYRGEKPTFKQLKAKNIRAEAARLEKTVNVLGPYGKPEEYEALYLFWLGIPYYDGERKRALLEEKRMEERILSRLRKEHSESQIQQFLAVLEREIADLEHEKNSFNINENYEADLDRFNALGTELNLLASRQSQLELRKELIEESRRELENDLADSQVERIADIYQQAKLLIPGLQKTYEETVAFHNRMLAEKITFITNELPELEDKLHDTQRRLQATLKEEASLKQRLQKTALFETLQSIIVQLNTKHERRGRLNERVEQIRLGKEKLREIEVALQSIDRSINELDGVIQERARAFNTFFSTISGNLYGEKFVLSAASEPSKRGDFYTLKIDSFSNRPGTGKKKGEIAAFDIAYIHFAEQHHIPCLHFILHDQLEVVDDNQLTGLLNEVLKARCQFIVPILRDKLPPALNLPEFQILSLGQEDKLFRT